MAGTIAAFAAAPVALVDCNNLYASCERVFQPGLRGKPVVVRRGALGAATLPSPKRKPDDGPWAGHAVMRQGRSDDSF